MSRGLRTHQRKALLYCMKVRHPALFMDCRLGKTRVILSRILQLKAIKHVLIICPYSAFKGWKDELIVYNEEQRGIIPLIEDKWSRYASLKGFNNNKYYIASKECHRVITKLKDFKWDVVVLDESQFISNMNASSRYYVKNFRDVRYRFLATGTPAEETELQYFNQLQFLDTEILDERNRWNFQIKYFTKDFDHKWIITQTGERYLTDRLAKYCFFMSRQDIKLGGKKIYIQRYVKLTDEIRKVYKKAARDFILKHEETFDFTLWAPVKWGWLRKICGGFLDGKFINPAKLNQLKYLLENDLHGQQVIIWAHYIEEILHIYKVLKKKYRVDYIYSKVKPIKREGIQTKFLKGKLDLLILQPGCFVHGVNLSSASAMVYYSSPVSGEIRRQTEDRTIDLGKQDNIVIIDIVTDRTVDEDTYNSLAKKEGQTEMLKRIVKGIYREAKEISK